MVEVGKTYTMYFQLKDLSGVVLDTPLASQNGAELIIFVPALPDYTLGNGVGCLDYDVRTQLPPDSLLVEESQQQQQHEEMLIATNITNAFYDIEILPEQISPLSVGRVNDINGMSFYSAPHTQCYGIMR